MADNKVKTFPATNFSMEYSHYQHIEGAFTSLVIRDGLWISREDTVFTGAKYNVLTRHYSVLAKKKIIKGRMQLILKPRDKSDDSLVMVEQEPGSISFSVASSTEKLVDKNFNKIKSLIPEAKVTEDKPRVDFWFRGPSGAERIIRRLEMPKFKDIRDNYETGTSSSLSKLISIDPREIIRSIGGKLLLFHGVPGTGKTFAIRSLIREWREFCNVHYILDPETFFMDLSYMNSIVLDYQDEPPSLQTGMNNCDSSDKKDTGKQKVNLIIIEDAGEILSTTAKTDTGQGFSRLLNLTSGMVGQGMQVLVLITTNEPIGRINKALARKGRCIANINFKPLSAKESTDWLKNHGLDNVKTKNSTCLADLYGTITDYMQISNIKPEHPIGFSLIDTPLNEDTSICRM